MLFFCTPHLLRYLVNIHKEHTVTRRANMYMSAEFYCLVHEKQLKIESSKTGDRNASFSAYIYTYIHMYVFVFIYDLPTYLKIQICMQGNVKSCNVLSCHVM